MTLSMHPQKPSSRQSASSARSTRQSHRPASQGTIAGRSSSIYFSPRGGIAAPIPYAAKPHPEVQFVAKPISEERTLSEALTGVVLNDDQYQESLKRLLGFQSDRLTARTVPVRHEVHEELSPRNHVGSPSKMSVVLASSKQQHETSLGDPQKSSRGSNRLPPRKPRPSDEPEARILAIDGPSSSMSGSRHRQRTSTTSAPDFSYSPSGPDQQLEPMVFTTRPRQDSIVYNRTSTPSASVTSGGRQKQKSGRFHWTQLSLQEPVDEDERSFQWAIACAKGIYHNQLPSCITDGSKAKPLPPVVKHLAERQKKEKLPELTSSSAMEVTNRLYTNSKAVRLSQEIATPVKMEKIGNFRSFKEAMSHNSSVSENSGTNRENEESKESHEAKANTDEQFV